MTLDPRGGRSVTATLDFPNYSVPESAFGLLAQAETGLADAELEDNSAQRFATAYLAALRGAAALLALRGRPHRARSRPMSVWTLLSSVAPELREWAAFFASCSATRASVQAGITRAVSTRSADDLTRQTGQFLELVARMIRGSRDQ
jgi:hypothetical protein